VRCRDEDAPILLRDVNANNAPIVARIHLTSCVALGSPYKSMQVVIFIEF
jgi:hypothetical protein